MNFQLLRVRREVLGGGPTRREERRAGGCPPGGEGARGIAGWLPGAGSRVRVAGRLATMGLLVAWRRSEKCVKAAGRSWPGGGWCPRTPSPEGLRGRGAGALARLPALGAVRMRPGGPWDLVGEVTGTGAERGLWRAAVHPGVGRGEARARLVSNRFPGEPRGRWP